MTNSKKELTVSELRDRQLDLLERLPVTERLRDIIKSYTIDATTHYKSMKLSEAYRVITLLICWMAAGKTKIVPKDLLKRYRKLLKEKYVSKKRHISKKKAKTKVNTCKQRINFQWQELEKKGHYYKQKAILKQLQELTKNVKQIKNKLRVIDKKLK